MFQSEELEDHLKTSSTLETESIIFAEWNLNDVDNIEKIGNYRYRPGTVGDQFSTLPNTYDPFDVGGYYTGATDASVGFETNFDDAGTPTLFTTKNEKMNLLYSLEDCIKEDRPRSGINKLLFLGDVANQYLDIGEKNPDSQEILSIARRPRYYMSSRKDQFKYWTSYRTDVVDGEQQEFGISRNPENGVSYIYDACPFIVYKEEVAANRIVIKMQTNVGDIDLGPFRSGTQEFPDPLYGYENQTTPQRWSVQVLKNEDWVSVIDFDENYLDENNEPIIKSDGYLEIAYGLDVPEFYKNFMVFSGELTDESLLPEQAPFGYTYLIRSSQEDRGILKFYDGGIWIDIVPEYRWFISNSTPGLQAPAVIKTSNPDYFINEGGDAEYREIDFIKGIRLAVKTMNVPQCTFDLIEISSRILVDISEKTSSFNITKIMSDLGNNSIPVGNVLASTGSIELFDEDFSFNMNNPFNLETRTGSVISKNVDKRCKLMFYQVVKNVQGLDYFIPIKTMYTDEIPAVSGSTASLSLTLRDRFFLFESSRAPELLITDASISYAVTLLLDYIGFSNCVFRRLPEESETVIPFFFVGPDQNIAEVLQQLAVASQTAMFFDEYNNLVVMSKEYLIPEEGQREIDSKLYGQLMVQNVDGQEYKFLGEVSSLSELPALKENGAYRNTQNNNIYVWSDQVNFWQPKGTFKKFIEPNIINLSSEEKRIYNQGTINYTTRYLQRAISRYSQAPYIDKFKTYGYKPALLWEVAGREQLRSQNETPQQTQGFTLSAAPLHSDLNDQIPIVVGNEVINNIIDLGDNINSVASYEGYFYANGEVIKYDAMEYVISGALAEEEGTTVWITNNQEYQRYFSRTPFNGKMYPTGLLRIFSEPEFEEDDNGVRLREGSVKKHGRGQFGTPVVYHDAGLNSFWSDNENVRGCFQEAKETLFNTSEIINYPELFQDVAGKNLRADLVSGEQEELVSIVANADQVAKDSTRTGLIKNFRANKYYTESESDYFDTSRSGTLQSSALVFNGPSLSDPISPEGFVSYIPKELPGPYKHFGTRMRIIGKIESENQKTQTPAGAFPIYDILEIDLDNPEKNIEILGGSGGIVFNLNKETNNGYYFEIVSLTQDNISKYQGLNKKKIVEEKILPSPQASVVNNLVTVSLENQTQFQVGQPIIFSGFSDKNAPKNISTPLNGEYRIDSISPDKKQIKYIIPTPSVSTLSITTAEANESVVRYNVPKGDTRQTFIKAGDKVSISGSSNSAFNLSNVFVKDFKQLTSGWFFTVENKYNSASNSSLSISSSGSKTLTTSANLPYAPGQSIEVIHSTSSSMTGTISSYDSSSGVLVFNVESSIGSGTYSTWSINASINISGTSSGGSVSYVPLNTFAGSGGKASYIESSGENNIANVFFYKILADENGRAIPYKLWSGLANILPDDGRFTGQYRFVGEENPTVYDLAVEHIQVGSAKRFFLFINGKQIATVTDLEPLPEYSGFGPFVRGGTYCMFENLYALGVNISQNSSATIADPISKFNSFWGDDEIDVNESLRKYALSGIIQKTYLSGIGTEEPPSHLLYYEEFGTIMREVAYLNIKYDRAFPALYAKVMKTFNRLKGYAISGFYANSYGADFLVFNCLDTSINLDDTTGNFLRIQGITFTQNTTKKLTVDDYYKKISDFSNPIVNSDLTIRDPSIERQEYNRIMNSRSKYGVNEFTIDTNYIQTDDAAENVFGWILDKVTRPKILVGLNTFGTFNLQLGDIVNVEYINNDGVNVIAFPDKRFVIYNIEYSKNNSGQNVVTYLAEV